MFATFDSAKVVPYTQLKPSAQSGCVNVILPDGRVFSGHHGDLEGNVRPAGTDGPWEQGQLTGSGGAITYRIDGQPETWLIVPVDKLP